MNNDLVTFLWAENYIQHPEDFKEFLKKCKAAIEATGTKAPCVMNHIELVQWNMDKKYLLDMQNAGFDIPRTEIVDTAQFASVSTLHQRLQAFQSCGPIVLKPTVSASSNNTRLVTDISALSVDDVMFLQSCIKGDLRSSLIVQQFEPAIATGEYSFVFIREKLSVAVLKEPKSGDFRCQHEFGGLHTRIETAEIEERTLSVVKSIFDTLWTRFENGSTGVMGYVRIDGMVTDDRAFVLMEIEAIEPHLYLEMAGLQDMLSLLLK
ncbi:hypothetical protein N7451_000727 [Penicillium sp. IBT 35674x]|nr:hypothetical protein N7451_000727 [Penicillium sp. IBT 35674x]